VLKDGCGDKDTHFKEAHFKITKVMHMEMKHKTEVCWTVSKAYREVNSLINIQLILDPNIAKRSQERSKHTGTRVHPIIFGMILAVHQLHSGHVSAMNRGAC
jgi:hypothetical protein